jgi:hypothetical protein
MFYIRSNSYFLSINMFINPFYNRSIYHILNKFYHHTSNNQVSTQHIGVYLNYHKFYKDNLCNIKIYTQISLLRILYIRIYYQGYILRKGSHMYFFYINLILCSYIHFFYHIRSNFVCLCN